MKTKKNQESKQNILCIISIQDVKTVNFLVIHICPLLGTFNELARVNVFWEFILSKGLQVKKHPFPFRQNNLAIGHRNHSVLNEKVPEMWGEETKTPDL